MNQATLEILEHTSLNEFLMSILDKENFPEITIEFVNNSTLTKKQKAFLHDALWIRKKENVLIEDGLKHYTSYLQELCESEISRQNPIFFLSEFRQCAIRLYFLTTKVKKCGTLFEDLLYSFALKTKSLPRKDVVLIFLTLGNDEQIKAAINDWKNEILSEKFLEFNNAYKDLYFLLVRKKPHTENCSSIFESILFLDGEEPFNEQKYSQVIKKLQKKLPDEKMLAEIKNQAVQNYISTQERSNGYSAPEKWLYDIANNIRLGDKFNNFNIKNSRKRDYESISSISLTTLIDKIENNKMSFEEAIQKIIQIAKTEFPNRLDILLNAGCISASSHYLTGETSPVHHSPYPSCFQDFEIKKIIRNQSLHEVSRAKIKAIISKLKANFVLPNFVTDEMETCFINIFDNGVNDFNKRLNINHLLFLHEVKLQSKKGDKGLTTRPKGSSTKIEKSKNYTGVSLEDYRNDAAHPKQSIKLGKHYLVFGKILQHYSEEIPNMLDDVEI